MTKRLNCHERRDIVTFSLLLIFLSLRIPETTTADVRDEAYTSIQLADEAVSSAFEAVLDAEGAGANVSGLILRLNDAGSLLAEAKISLRNRELGEVAELAEHIVKLAHGVEEEASTLKASALSHRESVLKISLMSSLVGVLAFLLFMLILWLLFRGFYIHRISRLRPEVASDAQS